jgi:signal transduction histidine kinase
LDPSVESHAFEAFVQGTATSAGIGLGLATVKRLVEAYRGRVGVHPATKRGSVFWFELPLLETATRRAVPSEPSQPILHS